MRVFDQLKNVSFEPILFASLPAASANVYRFFYVTDLDAVMYSDGAQWVTVGSPIISAEFKANGKFRSGGDVDGRHFIPFNAEIISVAAYVRDTGTSGTTTLDLAVETSPGAPWNSIFSTKPSFTSAAADNSYVDSAGVVAPGAGVTAPVLSTTSLVAGSVIGIDINTVSTGAADCGIIVHYRRV